MNEGFKLIVKGTCGGIIAALALLDNAKLIKDGVKILNSAKKTINSAVTTTTALIVKK